jgi:uncharacterized protein (DUF433 family)
MQGFDRITFAPERVGERACIRDARLAVSLLVNLVANGMSTDEITDAYPYVQAEDVRQALRYAAWRAEGGASSHTPVAPTRPLPAARNGRCPNPPFSEAPAP